MMFVFHLYLCLCIVCMHGMCVYVCMYACSDCVRSTYIYVCVLYVCMACVYMCVCMHAVIVFGYLCALMRLHFNIYRLYFRRRFSC